MAAARPSSAEGYLDDDGLDPATAGADPRDGARASRRGSDVDLTGSDGQVAGRRQRARGPRPTPVPTSPSAASRARRSPQNDGLTRNVRRDRARGNRRATRAFPPRSRPAISPSSGWRTSSCERARPAPARPRPWPRATSRSRPSCSRRSTRARPADAARRHPRRRRRRVPDASGNARDGQLHVELRAAAGGDRGDGVSVADRADRARGRLGRRRGAGGRGRHAAGLPAARRRRRGDVLRRADAGRVRGQRALRVGRRAGPRKCCSAAPPRETGRSCPARASSSSAAAT